MGWGGVEREGWGEAGWSGVGWGDWGGVGGLQCGRGCSRMAPACYFCRHGFVCRVSMHAFVFSCVSASPDFC